MQLNLSLSFALLKIFFTEVESRLSFAKVGCNFVSSSGLINDSFHRLRVGNK